MVPVMATADPSEIRAAVLWVLDSSEARAGAELVRYFAYRFRWDWLEDELRHRSETAVVPETGVRRAGTSESSKPSMTTGTISTSTRRGGRRPNSDWDMRIGHRTCTDRRSFETRWPVRSARYPAE